MYKKLAVGIFASSLALGIGIGDLGGTSKAEAAIPVEASISPKNVTKTGNSTTVTKTLNWHGGTGSTYRVYYYDGKSAAIDDSYQSFSTTNKTSYKLSSSQTKKTWYDSLRVSGSQTATDSGSITLKYQ